MASHKISAHIRDELVANVLAHKFAVERANIEAHSARIDEMRQERNKLGYELVYSEKIRKMMASAPKGHYPTAHSVKAMVEDEGVTEIKFGKAMLVPYDDQCGYNSRVVAVVQGSEPYFEKQKAIEKEEEDLQDKRRDLGQREREAIARVLAVINSVTTTGKLLEVWPEAQQFMPEMVSSSSGGVPAEFIGDLNHYLNLA